MVVALLCAAVFCAFGAEGASALGSAAFTCVKGTGTTEYKDSHCKEASTGGGFITTASESSVEIEAQSDPRSKAEEEAGIAKEELLFSVAGVKMNITCDDVVIKGGKVKNTFSGGVIAAHVTGAQKHSTKCHEIMVGSPTKTCAVKQGANPAGTMTWDKMTTTTKPESMKAVFEAEEEGGVLIEFELLQEGGSGCPASLNKLKVKVTGSVSGEFTEAAPTHMTFSGSQAALLVNGSAAESNATFNWFKTGEPEATLAFKTS